MTATVESSKSSPQLLVLITSHERLPMRLAMAHKSTPVCVDYVTCHETSRVENFFFPFGNQINLPGASP